MAEIVEFKSNGNTLDAELAAKIWPEVVTFLHEKLR